MAVVLPVTNTEARTWSMYPELYNDVLCLFRAHHLLYEFNDINEGNNCTRSYDTNIIDQFKCSNTLYETDEWLSKVVIVTI